MSHMREDIIETAKRVEACYGIPWRILAAQAALESGWGSSALAVAANNYVGMKWVPSMWRPKHGQMTQEWDAEKGKMVKKDANFVRYAGLEDCLAHLAMTLTHSGSFIAFRRDLAGATASEPITPAAIYELARVYASDPRYADKLWTIMLDLDGGKESEQA